MNEAVDQLGRLANTRNLITAEQVRSWCGHPDTQVTVRPVLDLADHVHVSAYEVPDRMAEATALLDLTCVFPGCTRPARGCQVERGTYLWTSPLGLSFLRDHDGTLDVTREHPTRPVRACAQPPDS